MITSLLISWLALQAPTQTPKGTPPAAPAKQTQAAPKPAPETPVSYDLRTAPDPKTVVATVNGEPITAGDVEKYIWDWHSDEVIDNLASIAVINQEAKKKNLTVTKAEIDKGIEDQLLQIRNSLPPGQELWSVLKRQGYTPHRFALTVKSSLLLDKIALADFKPNEFVKLSMIVVKPTTDKPEDVTIATKKAMEYYDQLKKGVAWTNVLASSTTDKDAIKSGGQIFWRALSAFPADAVPLIKSIPVGGYSPPIRTSVGVQVFRIDATGATASSADLATLKQQYAASRKKEVVENLRKAAKIVKTSP